MAENHVKMMLSIDRGPGYPVERSAVNLREFEWDDMVNIGSKPIPGTVTFEEGVEWMKRRARRRDYLRARAHQLAEHILDQWDGRRVPADADAP